MITPRIPCRTAETPLDIPADPETTSARIRKAVEREYARKLQDLLEVSTYWGYERRANAAWLLPLAKEMGALLGWDTERVDAEVQGFLAAVALP